MTPGLRNARAAGGAVRPRSGGRPSREDSQARQLRVLQVAQRAFLALGYTGTSLDHIAREAGVAKKTLYDHYGNKAGLFTVVVRRLRSAWVDGLRQIVIDAPDPRTALPAVARHLLDMGTRREMIALHRLLLVEARRFPDMIEGCYDERGALLDMAPLACYLRGAADAGLLQLDDVDLACEQFVFLVLGGIRVRILRGVSARPDAQECARIAGQAVRIFLQGSLVPAAPDTRVH